MTDQVQEWINDDVVSVVTPGRALVDISPESNSLVVALRTEAEGLSRYANEFTVGFPDDVKRATEDLSLISTLQKRIEA